MPQITVILRAGDERVIEGENGYSLMEAIRDSGIEELAAICGGACSCATCHVHIIDSPIDLPLMSEDESDLLEGSCDRAIDSRLSCQISVSAALDGLVVRIAAED